MKLFPSTEMLLPRTHLSPRPRLQQTFAPGLGPGLTVTGHVQYLFVLDCSTPLIFV
jgi:hypothetical protein